ncbi:peptidase M14 [Bacteroidia bacterium]|nr:peptidase M14 [Bacteroidia bacterium]
MALSIASSAFAEKLSYYFDPSIQFDSKIPTPEQFLGYEIGTHVTEHHQINAYFNELARLSDRAQIIPIGKTHEGRQINILAVSDPSNLSKLDDIKQARAKAKTGEIPHTPLVVFLGFSVHGNETSAAEAALLTAYYLVAAQTDLVKQELKDGLYFVDPVRNPDGQERFAHWINSNASVNFTNDHPLDREHLEGWPRGRGNHYWFDMNRDWINTVQPESKARVAFYQDWLPHVQADHHEMGTNSTFFFEPTDPNGNESHLVPQSTYKLNAQFAEYYSKALDKIGSFYYTKEGYDNKNPTFGSTYPDYNGAVGILFEQGSSRGIHQRSDNGIVTFGHTLRNQLTAAIATVDAANGHKQDLFNLQKEFFTASKGNAKAYLIGDNYDVSRVNKFVNLLLRHHLEVYENTQDVTIDGVKYEKGKSYIVPVGQPNAALVQIIFDEKTDYTDPTKLGGYGAGFSVAYSSGLAYATVTKANRGARVETPLSNTIVPFTQSNYAYVVDYRDSKAQQLLFDLLQKNVLVQAAYKPFTIQTNDGEKELSYGSLLIPVSLQSLSSNDLYALLKELGTKENVNILSVPSGFSAKGVDLGSSSFRTVNKPEVLVVTGGDVSATEAGEVWHLFDQKLAYPVVRVDDATFGRASLKEFNRIVFVSGSYSFLTPAAIQALKQWVSDGGTLITFNSASLWAATLTARNDSVANRLRGNGGGRGAYGRQPNSVFEAKIKLDSPLAFGLTREILPIVKENGVFLPLASDTTKSVATYSADPLLNGYVDDAGKENFKKSASIKVENLGTGTIVQFAEDPLFRGTWDATERTFINAVAFGDRLGGGFRFY